MIFIISATIITLLSAYFQRKSKSVFITLLFAAAFFAACIFISRLGNLPIQTEMLKWDMNSLPDNWEMLRDKWWSLHIYRTIAELSALVLVAWTMAKSPVAE